MSKIKGVFSAKASSPKADPQTGSSEPGGKKAFSSKDYDFAADLAEIRERMRDPNYGKEKKEFTRQEVIQHFSELAEGFERVVPDLNIPDIMYKRDERGNTFSEKPDRDSSYLADMAKMVNARFPDASELVYTLGIFDTASQTYFVMVDPKRKLVVVDQLLYLGEGSWDHVSASFFSALGAQMVAEHEKKKYNLVVASHGSARLV